MGKYNFKNVSEKKEVFVNTLTDKNTYSFKSMGKYNFKNVSEKKEVFEVITDNPDNIHIDPICRMLLNSEEQLLLHPTEANIFFCSRHCLNIYVNVKTNSKK